ncbi:MAG: MFS transporter, partial [Chloroflexi bacterium]|nr:MFS transporter [Chloroflexota bacterium]
LESAFFVIGMSLVSATAVLPPLIARLSGSTVVVGLAAGLFNGAWLLPQVFVAGAIAGLRRTKPVIVASVWVSRTFFLVAALVILFAGGTHPRLTVAALLICITLFYAVDAIAAVPWFGMLSRCIPANRRGRLIGLSEVLGGLGGIGTGIFVRYALGESSPWAFPTSYAVLFAGAALFLQLGSATLSTIKELPAAEPLEERPTPRQALRQLPSILVDDHPFRRLVFVRLAAGFVGVASSFYVLHATRHMGLGTEVTGYFVSAQVIGSLAAGLLTSLLQDRHGPLAHMRVMAILAALPALLGLLAEPLAPLLGAQLVLLYLALFFVLGLFLGSSAWPFFNWTLEYAPEARRPAYIGLINTLGGLYMLAPVLGGLVVRSLSYRAVFALALGFAALALLLSKGLPSTRNAPPTAAS